MPPRIDIECLTHCDKTWVEFALPYAIGYVGSGPECVWNLRQHLVRLNPAQGHILYLCSSMFHMRLCIMLSSSKLLLQGEFIHLGTCLATALSGKFTSQCILGYDSVLVLMSR